MNREQHKDLQQVLQTNTTITLSGAAARIGISEESLAVVLCEKGVLLYRRAGTEWIRGSLARNVVRPRA